MERCKQAYALLREQLEAKEIARLDIVRFAKGDIERHEAVREVLEIYGDM